MMKPLLSLCVLASLCLPQPTAADQTDYAEYTPAPVNPASVHAADMRAWLQQLSPSQRAKAQAVIDEYSPKVNELRKSIMQKKNELAQLSYNQKTSPETLPRLGHELQQLRDELRDLLQRADQRMDNEVGVPLGSPQTRGCSMEYPGLSTSASK